MAVSFVLLLAATCVRSALSAQLPSYITPCSRSDPKLNECALKNGNAAIPFLTKGDRAKGIPPLQPLHLEKVEVKQGAGAVAMDMTLTDVDVHHLGDMRIQSISFDLENKAVNVSLKAPVVQVIGNYSIDGRVLLLPIKGNGGINITVEDMVCRYSTTFYTSKGGDGNEYIHFNNGILDTDTGHSHYYLGNLFNGDRTLGDNLNQFLKENWREVNQEIGPVVDEVINGLIHQLMDLIVKDVPYDSVFPK
ncbi:protein takeout-like [Bacillus rossius redtenbacheri]|uniref:protein takeout-like n=1 Tax=Bacillus rossius redtenbacheri TaxID=93214 RepID=UPI002FDE8BC9